MASAPHHSVSAPTAFRPRRAQPIGSKSIEASSAAQVSQATGKEASPKEAAAETTAASERRAPTGAMTRWTSVPLCRSKPMMPAAQVAVDHRPMTPARVQPWAGVTAPQARTARYWTSAVIAAVTAITWTK